jgi:hypothetical protein
MTRRFTLGLCALVGVCLASSAHLAAGAWPPDETAGPIDYSDPANWPNDPSYKGYWKYWSFVPSKLRSLVDDRTRRLGTGAHYDRAWAKTTGDPRVVIAVTDSGIEWSRGDLVNRMYLNPNGELPPPESCPGADPGAKKLDVNGDGRFNVQDYTTATGHELPSFDKVCDLRVKQKGDTNGNGVLDAQDLIRVFSNGVDEDGNGYVDDISGWDFFHNDNDPQDDTEFGHGSGSSEDSVAEPNNGMGGIGTCPDCTLMMLRVGDAFVPEVNNWAMSVIYAVDNGAHVVNMSGGGGLTNPAFGRDALDYAWENGVSVVISNSDLNSFHHNSPNTNNHNIAVHAIVHDGNDWDTSTTFFNYNACTNYGAHLTLSVPANGCSSEASGRYGGALGLIYAAALKANIPPPKTFAGDPKQTRRLTAEEVRQIAIGTVDTFFDPADATDPTKFPTKNGFARRFGYGRPNLRTAVDEVMAGRLRPEVDVTAPLWFDVIDPRRTPSVPIIGRVGLRGGSTMPAGTTVSYVVEWAPGVDPDDIEFKTIGQADMLSAAVDGPLAMWDVSNIEVMNTPPPPGDPRWQPDDPVNLYKVTLRVRATVSSTDPAWNGARGEFRKAVSIYRDRELLPAFPIFVGSSGEASPKVVDLNGDKKMEIVLADSSGRVHAYQADGSELAGWPVHVETLPLLADGAKGHRAAGAFQSGRLSAERWSPIAATPAVGDLDNDGSLEIVVASWYGKVWAFHADGSVVAGFPVDVDRDSAPIAVNDKNELEDAFFASPVLADLTGDETLEIVAGSMDGKLYAWDAKGARVPGFPVVVQDPTAAEPQRQRIMTTPAVGDLNKDGIVDIVCGTNENYSNTGRLYAVDGRGTAAPGGSPYLPGWPISIVSTRFLPVVAQGLPISPALVDVDGDKRLEVVVSGLASVPKVFDATGKPFGPAMANNREKYGEKSNAQNGVFFTFVSYPAVADLDDDGRPDLVEGGAGTDAALSFAAGGIRKDFEHHMGAWDMKSGQLKRGFPRVMEDWQFFSTAAMADVDGDGRVNVIAGSGGYFIHGWNVDGVEAKGFPKYTGGWVLTTPAVGDLDGDGKLELVANTRNGYLFAWKTEGRVDGRIDWGSFHHDLRNSGNFEAGPDFGRRASPGGCAVAAPVEASAGRGLALVLIGAAMILVVARRRRS